MRMTLVYLTGSLRGRTQFIDTDFVTFGVGGDCGIAFDPTIDATVCPIHAELSVVDHTPMIRDRSGKNALLVNGERKTEATLEDGDLIQFGDDGPQVRFRLTPDGVPATKPLRTIVVDSRDIVVRTPHPRFLSPVYLLRHVLTDIAVHASPLGKLGAALLVLVPLAIIVVLSVAVYRQQQAGVTAKQRMAELIGQLETGRLTQAELERRIEQERQAAAELRRQKEAEIATLTERLKEQEAKQKPEEDIRAIREQLAALQQTQTFAEEIARRFEQGVGLLQGSYGFREQATGRPLRYRGFDDRGDPLLDEKGNTLVTVEGHAPPITIFFAGTAFVIDEQGTVMTNRHLVRMWESFEPAKQAIAAGFEPEMLLLRLFLPHQPEAYRLRLVALSEKTDLALLRTDRRPTGVLPVTLASEGHIARVGEPIIMLSYPGSIDTLLARGEAAVTKEILATRGRDPVRLAEEVAHRGLIRPLATQGHVSDVAPDVLTYEAGSAMGSSGAPIFNRAGAVIAVNQAALQRVSGVHLALPVRLVRELLEQTGSERGP